VFNVLCDLLTGEYTTQPALRTPSGPVGIDFELGHHLQDWYCSFVVLENCEVPAPLAEGNCFRLLCSDVSCGILAQVLLALPQFVIVGLGRCPCAQTQPFGETHLSHAPLAHLCNDEL